VSMLNRTELGPDSFTGIGEVWLPYSLPDNIQTTANHIPARTYLEHSKNKNSRATPLYKLPPIVSNDSSVNLFSKNNTYAKAVGSSPVQQACSTSAITTGDKVSASFAAVSSWPEDFRAEARRRGEMKDSAYWIKKLGLAPHPEGGWFRETYRAAEGIPVAGLPRRFRGERAFSTAIYFLLESGQFSALHRIKSDELWFFHAGGSLAISSISTGGQSHTTQLGNNPDRGESFQAVVPAGSWFGARPLKSASYSLVSCTVAPGFDFSDFEMGKREKLLKLFPACREIIEQLTRGKG